MSRNLSNDGPRYDLHAENEAKFQQNLLSYSGPEPVDLDSTSQRQESNAERERWETERQNFVGQIEALQQVIDALRLTKLGANQALRLERQRYARLLKTAEEHDETLRASMKTLQKTAEEHDEGLRANMKILLDSRDEELHRLRQELDKCRDAHEKEIEQIKANQQAIQKENIDLHYELQQMMLESPIESEEMPATDTDDTATSVPVWRSQFSLYLRYRWCCFVGPRAFEWQYRKQHPIQLNSSLIQSISIVFNREDFVARYRTGGWLRSDELAILYPRLVLGINQFGLQNLDVCFLGTPGSFFARWQDGSVLMSGCKSYLATIESVAATVVNVAFGIGGSYVFSYLTEDDGIDHRWDLKGCYKQLEDILQKNNGQFALEAIALDMARETDFVMVTWVRKWDDSVIYDLKRKISFRSVDKKLLSWWKACSESNDTSNVYLPVTS